MHSNVASPHVRPAKATSSASRSFIKTVLDFEEDGMLSPYLFVVFQMLTLLLQSLYMMVARNQSITTAIWIISALISPSSLMWFHLVLLPLLPIPCLLIQERMVLPLV